MSIVETTPNLGSACTGKDQHVPLSLAPGPYGTFSSQKTSLGYLLLHLENEGMKLNGLTSAF